MIDLRAGDCRHVLASMPDASVDAVVTDPPYELGFMGKKWDGTGIAYDVGMWAEVLRVLKPGGHLLSFGGTRTWHRMACAVEDAGFEVRDSIAWLYGSGFPKSLDVGKAIDKLDAAADQEARRHRFTAWVRSTGATARQIDEATGTSMGNHYTTHPTQPAVMTTEHLDACRHLLGAVPDWVERECQIRSVESRNYTSREVIGTRSVPTGHAFAGSTYGGDSASTVTPLTAPATPDAVRWDGWGTALKPAHEPIVVARKPFPGTVAGNVVEHGTGALNIDACRIGTSEDTARKRSIVRTTAAPFGVGAAMGGNGHAAGRWPANVVLDETCADLLDEQSGTLTTGAMTGNRNAPKFGGAAASTYSGGTFTGEEKPRPADSGGASRFFYCAKAPTKERPRHDGTAHPTVKPLTLMRWLVRLVTPPDGTVLDPFTGSGTTLEAALLEGFHAIGIEQNPDYLPLIRQRLARHDDTLFGAAP